MSRSGSFARRGKPTQRSGSAEGPEGRAKTPIRCVAYMDVGEGREQDALSFAYMDVGEGREQDALSFALLAKD